MTKAKTPSPESDSGSRSEDVERRVGSVEQSINELRKNQLEGHKWFTTVMFTLVALLLTVLGISSKSDVREAVRDMRTELRNGSQDEQAKIEAATREMEKRFVALSGEVLKKPLLTISDKQGLLDGRKFELTSGSAFPIYPMFLTNEGNKKSDPLSIRLYMSEDLFANGSMDWSKVTTNDKEFPVSYYLVLDSRTLSGGIAPKETWTLESSFGFQSVIAPTNLVSCRLLVFYGAEKPAEARFVIRFK